MEAGVQLFVMEMMAICLSPQMPAYIPNRYGGGPQPEAQWGQKEPDPSSLRDTRTN